MLSGWHGSGSRHPGGILASAGLLQKSTAPRVRENAKTKTDENTKIPFMVSSFLFLSSSPISDCILIDIDAFANNAIPAFMVDRNFLAECDAGCLS